MAYKGIYLHIIKLEKQDTYSSSFESSSDIVNDVSPSVVPPAALAPISLDAVSVAPTNQEARIMASVGAAQVTSRESNFNVYYFCRLSKG